VPELPDVDGFRRVLADHAVGRRIDRVEVSDAGVLRGTSAGDFDAALRGHRFCEPRRHGKWLIATTSGPTVLMHFGMTGALRWAAPGASAGRFDRVSFVTPEGELRFEDMRKLQGITLARGDDEVRGVIGRLGPDALSVPPADFARLLKGRRGAIKAVLINQKIIAGLGNLLADEILWRARINPFRSARDLSDAEQRVLHTEMRRVLRASLTASRVPPRGSWLTGVRDRPGARCPRCGTPLSRGTVAGRTTVWCPKCQHA
jgi:formamidopyrimidine-DNA glycosylase